MTLPKPGEVTLAEEAKATHPGFTIICDACQAETVYVYNTLGFSAASGSWGSIDLVCGNCERVTTLVEG